MHSTTTTTKLSTLELIYGPDVAQRIITAKTLVVGAGGIGCELMKTLSVTGFRKVTIIDLDTIDVSNLNRQFLFRREHVDKSKAEVLRDQIMKQNPDIEVQAFVGRIQEERFGFKFFSEFDLVINALDNEEARKHVNNMCFNLGIPLVDSGTNGYAAQCIPIFKGKTPCYQCVERPKDQSFPVCTIRQKPEKMIHCIVWAKALFEGLFGPKEQSNNIIEDIVAEISQSSQASADKVTYAQIVFDRVFGAEVKVLVDNISAKLQHQETPAHQEDQESDKVFIEKIRVLEFSKFKEMISTMLNDPSHQLNQDSLSDELSLKVLSVDQYIYTFVKSIIKLYEERAAEIGQLTFNKDDDLIVEFVSAAANIRAHNFSIQMESKFKIKEMAGKIIPAISSSNALVASLQVLESIKILAGKYDQLHGVVYQRLDSQRLQSFKRINDEPNPDCPICTDDSKWIYALTVRDLSTLPLSTLVNDVLHTSLALNSLVLEFNNDILFEEGDDIDEDEEELYLRRSKKSLADLKIRDLSIVQVQGTEQVGKECQVYLQVYEDASLEKDWRVDLLKKAGAKKTKAQAVMKPQVTTTKSATTTNKEGSIDLSDDSQDDIQVDEKQTLTLPEKRPPSAVIDEVDTGSVKRARAE